MAKTLTIQMRRSATASAVPATLLAGEPAVNVSDKKLYSSDGSTVFQVAPSMTEHAAKASLVSPTFTGTPASTTAAVDTNTTQVATTAFVVGQAASATPLVDGTAAVGTSTRFARADHVHPTDTTRAPLVSPTFTGTPSAPTAAVGTNTTQVATTAFVATAVSNLVASSPAALDTLNELSAALGNDANFATTMTNALAGKEATFTAIDGGTY